MQDIIDDSSVIKPALKQLKLNFRKGLTRDFSVRKQALTSLLNGLEELKAQFEEAISKDLGLNSFNSELFSSFITKKQVQNNLNNLEKWARPTEFQTPVAIGPGKSYTLPQPYGVVLVLSAWNYPLYTAVGAVAPAIAAGNCVILKPSELAPCTSKKYLNKDFYRVIEGKVEVAKAIVEQPFDLIIFTGSPQKGRLVAQAAAKNLTPCILELGGKNPTIVDEDADLQVSAMRIVQGRFVNSGQTCVAPEYVMVHKKVKQEFIKQVVNITKKFYPDNQNLAKIVNKDHTRRLKSYLEEKHGGVLALGGRADVESQTVQPTIIVDPSLSSCIMRQQIFGPILAIIQFSNISETIEFINDNQKPLALYYFGAKNKDLLIRSTSSGALVVNDCIFHVVHTQLPFGGVGNSGYGAYHGKFGFDGCSHVKPVLQKGTLNLFPLSARYPPYSESQKKLLMFMMRNSFMGQHKLLWTLGLLGLAVGSGVLFWTGKWKDLPIIGGIFSKL